MSITKTKKELTIKEIMDHPSYEEEKEKVRKEINRHKHVIDWKVFKKTPEEKGKLFNLKQEWKRNQKHK